MDVLLLLMRIDENSSFVRKLARIILSVYFISANNIFREAGPDHPAGYMKPEH